MKKIYILLLMALPALMLQSCLKDQEDVFNKSASARMSEYLKNANDVLVGASNGWALDYYPDREQSYGGYAYTVQFNREGVDIRTEMDGGEEVYSSLYKLVADDGPVLTFDTYNPALHYFATPWGSSGGYEAYDGDFEFIIMEATPQRVTLKGKRSGNIMYMYPLQRPAEDYIADVASLVADLPIVGATGKIGTADVKMDITLMGEDHHIDIETPDTTFSAPYVFYDKGIRFYEPLEIGGKKVYQMEYNNDAVTLSCTDEGSTDVVLAGILSPATLIKSTGSSMAFDNSANTATFSINKLSEFTLSTDVDWIHITTSGNTLTISVDANTTGAPRSGSILVEIGGLSDVISVTQIEVTDFLGEYTMTCIDSDEKPYTSPVLVQDLGNGQFSLTFNYPNANYPQTIMMTWNEAATRFEFSCGQTLGRLGQYISFLCFIDAGFNYWSSTSTTGTAYFVPSVNAEGKVVLSIAGTYGSFQVGGLCILVGTDPDIANQLGWYEAFMQVAFTKN